MQNSLEKHTVNLLENKIRVSDYLPNKFDIVSTRKGIKKALKQGRIMHNGKTASSGTFVQLNDIFELLEDVRTPPKTFPLDLDVLYEDEFLAIIHKPAGYPVAGNKFKTILNCLGHNLQNSNKKDALPWPLPIHRLDVATSGLLIIAKTYAARVKLGEQLAQRAIHKTYRAVVQGNLKASGNLTSSIDEKASCSTFQSIKTIASPRNNGLTLVALSPITGRTHQLRIHMSRLGFPIVGDQLYGKEGNVMKHKGLFLCAVSVFFLHPITQKKVVAQIEQPPKFNALLKREASNYSPT